MELQKLMDDAGLTFIGASNGEKGQSTNFIDPDQIPKTMADHIAFCRDFLQPLGCDHWKINMGERPAGGPSEEQLKRLADTLNDWAPRPSPWACACRRIPISGARWSAKRTCAG